MAGINDYSNTAGSNTTINGIDIAEGCSPAGINNAIRQLMADIADVDDGVVPLQTPDINGGTIDGATIGGSSTIDNSIIGGTTPAAGTFTTLTANTSITGTLNTAAQTNITSVGTLSALTVSGDLTVDTDTLYVDSSNNRVGVGQLNPSANLHVGNDTAGNENTSIRIEGGSTSGYSQVHFADSGDVNVGRVQYTHSSNTMAFYTNDTEAVRIDDSGNLLSNTTEILPYVTNVTGISLASGSYGGLLCASRDGGTPLELNRKTSDGAILQFRKDGTAKGSIDVNSSGIAIRLGGTADANSLDDYEEGTWTPSLGGTTTNPTTNYNHQVGRYTKIGRTVTIDFYIQLLSSGNSGGTGALTINGFPFNVGSLGTHGKSGLCMYTANFSTVGNGAPIGFFANQNNTQAYFRSPVSSYPSTSFHTSTLASDVGNNLIVAGTLTYQIT